MPLWIVWAIIAVVMLIVEMMGPNLVSIWFAIAALIMAPLSLLNWPIPLQIAAFIVLSVILMIILRKVYLEKIKPKNMLKDNLQDKILDQIGVVSKTIDNRKDEGQVMVSGVYWRAISSDDSVIEKGESIKVERIEAMKVIVSKN